MPQGAGMLDRLKFRLKSAARLVNLTEAQPFRLGLAVALGFTIGLTPLYGLHLLIAILVSIGLRLNVAVVYAVANVSLPPFVPIIAVSCVQVGHWAVHGATLPLLEQSADQLLKTFPLYWLVGSLLIGPSLGGMLGAIVYAAVKHRRRQPCALLPFDHSLDRVYAAFLPEGRWTAEVIRGKTKHDVVYRRIFDAARQAPRLIDVGGGHGVLPLLITAARLETKDKSFLTNTAAAVVLDWDEPKLAAGQRAAARLGVAVEFVQGDAYTSPHLAPGSADCITCLDVLHYAPLAAQRALVDKLARALKPGGRLIIRDMNRDLGLRTFCTVVQEKLSLLTKRTLASAIVPRSGRDLTAQLQAAGLRVTSEPCFGATPFSNTLWVAERPV